MICRNNSLVTFSVTLLIRDVILAQQLSISCLEGTCLPECPPSVWLHFAIELKTTCGAYQDGPDGASNFETWIRHSYEISPNFRVHLHCCYMRPAYACRLRFAHIAHSCNRPFHTRKRLALVRAATHVLSYTVLRNSASSRSPVCAV